MPSTLGNLHRTREICGGTISVAYITTRKMPHRTQVEGECLRLGHLFQGMSDRLLNTLRNAAFVLVAILSAGG